MRTWLFIFTFLFLSNTLISQVTPETKERRLRGLPADYKRQPSDPPMRGEKDLRPKQFPSRNMQVQQKDISPTLRVISILKLGDSTTVPVAAIPDLHIVLVRHYQRANVDAWSFRVTNPYYNGGWLMINRVKDSKTGELKLYGRYLRKGFSDALLLKQDGTKTYLEIVDQETIVQD